MKKIINPQIKLKILYCKIHDFVQSYGIYSTELLNPDRSFIKFRFYQHNHLIESESKRSDIQLTLYSRNPGSSNTYIDIFDSELFALHPLVNDSGGHLILTESNFFSKYKSYYLRKNGEDLDSGLIIDNYKLIDSYLARIAEIEPSLKVKKLLKI